MATGTRDDLDVFAIPFPYGSAGEPKIEIGVTDHTFPTGRYTGVIFLDGAEVHRAEFGRGDLDAGALELAGTFAIFAVDDGLPEALEEHAERIDNWGHDALPSGIGEIRETIIASTGEAGDARARLLATLILYASTREEPYSVADFTAFYASEEIQARLNLAFPEQD